MTITLHTALLIALIALQIADAALTINIMRLGGRETNKLLILLIGKFGRDAVLVGSKLAFIAAAVYWRDQISVQVLAFVVAGYVGIVAWNVRVLIKQREIHRAAQ